VYDPGFPNTYALLGVNRIDVTLPGIPCPIRTDFFAAVPISLTTAFTTVPFVAPPFGFTLQFAMIDGGSVC
jgi:hypothetical protein